jgi:PIN domain nuclease of toxin-antitoxin system
MNLELASLDPSIAIRSTRLPGAFHADPADRIIVATALEGSAVLITPDRRILAYPHARAAW